MAISTGKSRATSSQRRWRFPRLPECPACLYDLSGLPDEHECPECGLQYDRSMALLRVQSGRGSRWRQYQTIVGYAWPAAWLLAWFFGRVTFAAFVIAYLVGLVAIPLSFAALQHVLRAKYGGDARIWILPTEVREQDMFGRYRAHSWRKCRSVRVTPALQFPLASGRTNRWRLRILPAWKPIPTWWGIDVHVECDRRDASRLRNSIRRSIKRAHRMNSSAVN